MNRQDAKDARKYSTKRARIERVATIVVGSAIRVHRELGPGLLESAYQTCLTHELRVAGCRVECEKWLPIRYREVLLDVGYRIDMVVDGLVIIENKTVERTLPIHRAQLLSYLRISGHKLGFLINWHVDLVKNGIQRMVLRL